MSHTSIELPRLAPPVFLQDPAHSNAITLVKSNPQVVSETPQTKTQGSNDENTDESISKSRTTAVILSISCTTALGSLLAGLLTVGIPVMARELQLDNSLQLWPASIYALTCGCTLLLFGSLADVIGCRRMYLVGTFLQSAFTLGCGLSVNGSQLIIFRGLAGIAASFCLPSAVSVITRTFTAGPRRNLAFSALGSGQPIGFSLGLALGGIFADTIGWRWGFHMATILNSLVLVVSFWALPTDLDESQIPWKQLLTKVDWIGALLISTSLALLSYVFALITGSTSSIRSATTIALLITACGMIPLFSMWVGRQERLSRPALIPNSLWRGIPFSSISLTVFLVWGAFNAVEQTMAFYLQFVRNYSSLQSSLYFLPAPVSGALANLFIGLYLPKLRPHYTVLFACVIAGLSPLLLATLAQVDSPSYWACVFPAMALNPVAPDAIYTIANLYITESFPESTQAVAGGVFNTIAQIGKSVGLAATAVIAARVTAEHPEAAEPVSLLYGYKAAWWYCFALSLLTTLICGWGLRNVGKLGIKKD